MNPLKIKRILVPLDFSITSLKALDHAVTLAKLTDAEIILLHIAEYIHATTDPFFGINPGLAVYESDIKNMSTESLNKVAEKLKKKGFVKVKTLSVTGRTHIEILRASKKIKADIIVMGTNGVSGFREFVMGSNTFSIVRDALCPVLSVQRKSIANGFKNILVPFSDMPHSREKVMYAIKIAELFDAKIHVLGIDDESTKSHLLKISREAEQIKKIIEKFGLKCNVKTISDSFNPKPVLSYAKKINADLIVTMGNINKQDITEYFTGSFSQQIINHSLIPVLSIQSSFNPAMVELWHGI